MIYGVFLCHRSALVLNSSFSASRFIAVKFILIPVYRIVNNVLLNSSVFQVIAHDMIVKTWLPSEINFGKLFMNGFCTN